MFDEKSKSLAISKPHNFRQILVIIDADITSETCQQTYSDVINVITFCVLSPLELVNMLKTEKVFRRLPPCQI
jgi:hypothetical protein